jgi:hypothetical protein
MCPSRILRSESPIRTNSVGDSEVFNGYTLFSRMGVVILDPRDCLDFMKSDEEELLLDFVEVAQVEA